jgi:drug/metabolite transporter (DMT)-like permease
MSRSFRIAIAWLLAAEACYAVMRVTARLSATASPLPWAEIAAVRFLGGAIVPLVSARVRGVSLRARDQKNAWLRSLFGTGGALSLFYALGTHALSVGDATTLYSTTPLWVAVLSGPVLGERVGVSVWLAVVAGFVGVATLLHSGFTSVGPTGFIVLAGACSYALAIFRVRRLSTSESSEPIPRDAWLPLALSALSGGIGQTIVAKAYAHESASRLAAFTYAGVVFTYLLEVVLFARTPLAHQLVGALIVIGAGVFVSVAAARRASRAAAGHEAGE